MKLGLSVLLVAVVLPALSSAFFFGLTLTNTAGATLLALNPTALGTLATVGIAGAALAGLAGAALALPPRPAPAPAPKPTRTYRKYHHRGRRDSATPVVDSQVYDAIFVDLAENKVDGCFQRLVCDIAASPVGFEHNLPILDGVRLAGEMDLSPVGSAVANGLLKALQFGSDLKNEAECEAVFNQCEWTGADMDRVIEDMRNQV